MYFMPQRKQKNTEENPLKRGVSNRRRKNRKRLAFFAVLMSVFGIAALILSLTVFFNIKKIEISGDSIYTDAQIVSASTLYIEKNMFTINKFNIISSMEKILPYIEKVSITRSLPGTVNIHVKPAQEASYIATGGGYVILSTQNKVLQNTKEKPQLPELLGSGIIGNTVGEPAEFESAFTEGIYNEILEVLPLIEAECKITFIDISKTFKLTFQINNNIYVNFGNNEALNSKINMLNYILSQRNISENYGIVDLANTQSTKGTFTPVYTQEDYLKRINNERASAEEPTEEINSNSQ